MKRIISLVLVIVLCLGLCIPAAAASTEKVDITYRAIKIVLNGSEITPCDAAGKTVEPFIMNSNGTTYLPLRAIGQALGLDVKWTPATNTVELTSGGAVKTGDGPAGSTTGKQNVAITYRDIKVILDGTQLTLKNALGQDVEPFILNSNSSVYLPLRVVGEAFGLEVGWDSASSTVSLKKAVEEPPTAPLSITAQPKSVECEVDDVVSFTVKAEGGKAPYTYQWMYSDNTAAWEKANNNSVHEGVTTDKLSVTISPTYFDYGCKYYCLVTDAAGNTARSDVVTVWEKESDFKFFTQPQSIEIEAGSDAKFEVEIEGGQYPYSFEWQAYGGIWADVRHVANVAIDVDEGYGISLMKTKDMSLADTPLRVIVTDANGKQLITDEFSFTVKETPLAAKTQPEDAYTIPGQPASFTFETSGGSGNIKYKWYYSYGSSGVWGEFPTNDFDAKGYNTNTLTVTPKGFSQLTVGNYNGTGLLFRCIAIDEKDEWIDSRTVRLYQSMSVKMISESEKLDLEEGESIFVSYSVELTCYTDGLSPKCQWQYCTEANPTWRNMDNGSWSLATTWYSEELIVKVSYDMLQSGYKFRCVVYDGKGGSIASGSVQPLPNILEADIVISRRYQDYLIITCSPDGGTAPYTIDWYCKADGSDKGKYIYSSDSINVDRDECGIYYCVVTDAEGEKVTTNQISVTSAHFYR